MLNCSSQLGCNELAQRLLSFTSSYAACSRHRPKLHLGPGMNSTLYMQQEVGNINVINVQEVGNINVA